jgi:hypothetical protein
MRVKITFLEESLGTSSSNPEIHSEFIASKAPDATSREEEVEAIGVEEVVEKSMTIFPKENGVPFYWDYQIKGFFKDSCGMLKRVPGTKSNKVTAYKKVIDGLIFPQPRKIMIHIPEGLSMGECQRPLRAQTAQGERIALAHSETVPAGSWIEFDVSMLDEKKHGSLVKEWLDYGKLRGISQWRNSGKGRFEYEILD